jgi:HAD superfamily hydrolase (TIGR01549 family)
MAEPAAGVTAIRAVVFDIDDTLLPWQTVPHWQWAWRPRGPVLSERHVLAVLHRTLHTWDRRRWQGLVGEAPPADLAAHRGFLASTLSEIAGHELPTTESEAVLNRFLRPAGEIETFPDAAPTLDRLRGDGFEVAAVTALPHEVADHVLRRAGISNLPIVVSGESAPGLPTAAEFRAAAQAVHRRPREVLLVGDLFWSDVRAAARAGLHPVLIDRRDWASRVQARRVRTLAEIPALAHEAPPPPETAVEGGGPEPPA